MPPIKPPRDVKRTEGEPHDRLTRICDQLLDTFDAADEKQDGDKLIVFISDGTKSGIGIHHDWEDPSAAVTALFIHLQAMMKSIGKEMIIVPINQNPQGN